MKLSKCSILLSALMFMMTLPLLASPQPELDEEAKKAVQKSDVVLLTKWINNGGDIQQTTKNGNTLLILASKIGDKPTMEFLLSKQPSVDHRNSAGATALMVAAKYGHEHVVEMLLEKGANPTVRNNSGISAARFALAYGHKELFQTLQQAMMEHYRNNPQTAPNS